MNFTGKRDVPLRMTTQGRPSAGPRRRAVLTWAAGIGPALALPALAGCADTALATDRSSALRAARLRATAAADSVDLRARYDATTAAHPSLAARLTPLRSQVARHAEAFGAAPHASATATRPAATPSRSASPAVSAAAPAVPARPDDALAALAREERRITDARTAALVDAPAELAPLLASVAACGAAHALLLRGGAS